MISRNRSLIVVLGLWLTLLTGFSSVATAAVPAFCERALTQPRITRALQDRLAHSPWNKTITVVVAVDLAELDLRTPVDSHLMRAGLILVDSSNARRDFQMVAVRGTVRNIKRAFTKLPLVWGGISMDLRVLDRLSRARVRGIQFPYSEPSGEFLMGEYDSPGVGSGEYDPVYRRNDPVIGGSDDRSSGDFSGGVDFGGSSGSSGGDADYLH